MSHNLWRIVFKVIVFTTDFNFELTNEVKNFFVSYGFGTATFDELLDDEDKRKYSQIGGVFNINGQVDLLTISPDADGFMHRGKR